jgi:hypothetical protein
MDKKIFFLILILAGIFLRIYRIDQLPAGFFIDEVTIAVDSKNIAQNGTDEYGRRFPFYFEALSDFRLPGYVYATSVAYKFFGPQLITVKIPALLASVGTIFLLGYFARILFRDKKYLPWISMAILSLSPFHIHFSRIGYETTFATFFMLLLFISLFQLLKKPRLGWLIISIFCIFISTWTYPAAKIIVPGVISAILILGALGMTFGNNRRNMIAYPLVLLFFCALTFIPGMLNKVADKRSLNYIREGTDGTLMGIIKNKPRLLITSWLHILDFQLLFKRGDLFAFRHGTKEQGLYLGIFAIPLIIGFFYSLKNWSKKSFSLPYIFLLLLITGVPSALTSNTPYGTRIVPVLIPLTLILALGVNYILAFLASKKMTIRLASYGVLISILFYQVFQFSHIYFVHFKTTSLPEFPKASTDMAIFIKDVKENNPDKQIFFLADSSCRHWSFDSLYLWYFADLDNDQMAVWNNQFRDKRYAYEGSPFDAYDNISIPSGKVENIFLYPGYKALDNAEKGSMMVKCGVHLPNINTDREKVLKIFYMFEEQKSDPYYVVTEKL